MCKIKLGPLLFDEMLNYGRINMLNNMYPRVKFRCSNDIMEKIWDSLLPSDGLNTLILHYFSDNGLKNGLS